MTSTSINPTPVRSVQVQYDVPADFLGDIDLVADRTQLHVTTRAVTGTYTFDGTDGGARALSTSVVRAAQRNDEAIAGLGRGNAVPSDFGTNVPAGTWRIAIDRDGSRNDQAFSGGFDGFVPAGLRDVLAAADQVIGTLARAQKG